MTKVPTVPLTYTVKKLALDCISFNPNNPRKHFDDESLKELALSIGANGILQAPGVRPQRAAGAVVPGKYILIWGECRTRAARMVPGLKEIEVRIYDVDEVKAAELALIENLQRKDLSPLEEAAGYRELQKKHGLSADEIAAGVERKRSWIYQTMKLLDLSPEAKTALTEEQISISHAMEIASISSEFHERALEVAVEGPYGDGPLSLREFQQWIKEEFMLDLANAPFDTKDANLVPKAGACTNCPKRTGVGQLELGKKPGIDLCKDKPCYGSKVDAQLAIEAKAGKKVLAVSKAEEVFDEGGNTSSGLDYNQRDFVLATKEVKAKVDKGDVVLAKNPYTQQLVELVPSKAVPREDGPARQVREKDPEEKRREREHKMRAAVQVAIADAMAQSKDVEAGNDAFLKAIACGVGRSVQHEPSKQLGKRLGLDPQPGDDFRELVQKHIQTLSGVQLRRVVLQLAYADCVPDFMYSGGLDDTLLEGAKKLRVDADKVEAATRAALKEEAQEKAESKKSGEQLAAKIAKVKKSKLTPMQQKALIEKMKAGAGLPDVEKVPTKVLAAAAKAKKAKSKKRGGGQALEAGEEGWR